MRSGDPWAFHLHVDVFLVMSVLVVAYIEGIRRLGPRHAPAGRPHATAKQRVRFGLGVALILVPATWPLHDIAEDYLFSVHMVQHTVLSLIAVPLMLIGTPSWLLSRVVRPLQPVVRRATRPLVATLLFNGVVAVSHAAGYVNYTSSHELAHFAAHTLLFAVSALMWLPVCHQLPELRPMSPPLRMVYLFGQSLLPNVPAIFLAFADNPIYRWYATAPRISGLSAVEDQQLAGAIMKVGGTTLIWGVIVVMFFRWYRATELDGGPDQLRWEDVERELARTPAPPEPRMG
ncbi:MAG TPA: cytochrome c oxidase assembly protein [Acidimicrobiales bacterium]|nr:cytochrome c oxidase assembly protein [Acidimicrobiales bacterium]